MREDERKGELRGTGGGGAGKESAEGKKRRREGDKEEERPRAERCIHRGLAGETMMGRTETVGESERETEGKKERMHLWIAR